MGVGLVEAVDDMRVTNPPSNPELLDALAKELVEHKFDLKHLIRTIMTSEVYGLSSTAAEFNAKDRRNYARYVPKRLSAEVLSDAIDSLTGSAEKFGGLPAGTRAIDLPDEAVGSYVLDVFGRSQRETPCECERSYAPNLAQVLYLMNSADIAEQVQRRRSADRQAGRHWQSRRRRWSANSICARIARLPRRTNWRTRPTTSADRRTRVPALGDLMWVMLNSKEFLFNH